MADKIEQLNIGIYIYKNAEVLDFSGPFEVFSTANRLNKKKTTNECIFDWRD